MNTIFSRSLLVAMVLPWLMPRAVVAQHASPLPVPEAKPIRGAHYPALSPDGKRLCLEYMGDLWTVPTSGGTATRITLHRAYDGYPRWSPDGNWIAFSSNREGNFDVFIVPARGGEARQITYHGADDYVADWSPDGTEILFMSAREGRFADLYTVSLRDGRLRRLTKDRTSSRYATFSPDGKTVAYARGGQQWWRPKYKGSLNTEVYAMPVNGGKTTRLTRYEGWDNWPMYSPDGKTVYFVSDRGGTSNLWKMSATGVGPEQVTHHTGDAVRFPSIARDGSRIAYECGFQIWTLQVQTTDDGRRTTAEAKPVTIYANGDALTNPDAQVTLTSGASGLSVSPDGKTLAFADRGDLWTVPAEGGDATRITKTAWAEYNPVWSPDGTKMAYSTDRNGNLDVYLIDLKSKVELRLTADDADETNAEFAPNGRFVAYTRSGGAAPGLYVLPLPEKGDPKPGDAVRVGPGPGVSSYDWSPDSRWLVYAQRDPTSTTDLWIVPTVGGTPVNVTRYPGVNANPQWSRDGKNIVFVSSRGGEARGGTMNVYRLPLQAPPPQDEAGPTPGAPGQDQGINEIGLPGGSESIRNPQSAIRNSEDGPDAQRRRRGVPPEQPEAPPAGVQVPPGRVPPRATNVRIGFDDIQNRAAPVTNTRDPIQSVSLSPDSRSVIFVMTVGGQTGWWMADLEGGSGAQRITGPGEVGTAPEFAPDGSKFYYLGNGGTIFQLTRGAPAPGRVSFNAQMDLDRRVEVAEAFNEAWRNLRTRFYDPKVHGADWPALRAKYEPLLKETAAKEDFAWLLLAMIGELNASHLGVTPPDEPGSKSATGYLGLTFDQDYAGPGLEVTEVMPKGPTAQAGRRVEPGEYVMAIDGQDVSFTESMYKTLRDRVGQNVELLVNSKPTKDGARTVKVRTISKAEYDNLDYDRWVEARRKKVDALSGGKLAYIHIRAMDQPSLQKFQRELFGDAQSKQGLVLDVRFNGGGRIHDDLLSVLTRRPHVFEVPRDAERSTQPFQLWDKPSVLLINEYSASDAEIFPNGFRQYGLGKLVGVPTYGAVIGTYDITLVDGTRFRIPTTGWYTLEGKNLENYGVPPDIRVENSPEDNATDNDRQLEAAVRLLLAQMAAK